jgi:predicted transposase/invertase (TIGR01784 family)
MALGIKPTVDFAFKRIFGSPENSPSLIGLLNAILDFPDPIEEVEILNPFSYQEFAEDKLIVLDVRARDSAGRWLNIEMQVSVYAGLLQRLTYYACSLYVDQLEAGQNYGTLRPAISICLLNKLLFADSDQPHFRFQLIDVPSGRLLSNSIEVHTVELTKYNLDESTIREAKAIEQWAFFLLFADQYDPQRLRDLLPSVAFERAIATAEIISAKTEDRVMYDQREKAQRDYEWAIAGAREEGMYLGQVQLLQRLLGEAETSTADLLTLTASQISELLAELQERLRSR